MKSILNEDGKVLFELHREPQRKHGEPQSLHLCGPLFSPRFSVGYPSNKKRQY
jgi:hypothetical protein